MIVDSMKAEQIYNEVSKDLIEVELKSDSLDRKLARAIKKSTTKIIDIIVDFKTKNNNNWKILITANKRVKTSRYILIYDSIFGKSIIQAQMGGVFAHFTPHLLKRYKERFFADKNIAPVELAIEFIQNNFDSSIKYTKSEICDNIVNLFSRINHGVLLGYTDEKMKMFFYRTFLSNDMLFENQKTEKESLDEIYENHTPNFFSSKD